MAREDDWITAVAHGRLRSVERAAREVLEHLDKVGWPILMNASVARLRAALDSDGSKAVL